MLQMITVAQILHRSLETSSYAPGYLIARYAAFHSERFLSSSSSACSSESASALSTSAKTTVPSGKDTVLLTASVPSWPVQPPKQSLSAKYRPWDVTRVLPVKSSYSRCSILWLRTCLYSCVFMHACLIHQISERMDTAMASFIRSMHNMVLSYPYTCFLYLYMFRRMRFLVQTLEEERVQASQTARCIPDFRCFPLQCFFQSMK